jgi:sRNA-binding protein
VIGIHVAIRAATGISGAIVREVLDEWTRQARYLAALVAGAARFGLDGELGSAVTIEQAARAAERLAQRAAAEAAKGEPSAPGEPVASS